jgi:hypothetical protein
MTSTQKRSRDEAKAKYEAEMTEQAPKMLELAQKALEAVQAMMALETQMKEKNGDNCTVFSSDDERTLKEAEWAINIARDIAEEHVERAKKAKTDA